MVDSVNAGLVNVPTSMGFENSGGNANTTADPNVVNDLNTAITEEEALAEAYGIIGSSINSPQFSAAENPQDAVKKLGEEKDEGEGGEAGEESVGG